MSNEIKIVGRALEFDSFVINSFLKSYRSEKESLPNAEYYSTYSKLIIDYLNRFEIIFAVNPNNSDQIYGWLLCDPKTNTLIYAYVKYPFRRFGIFNELCMASQLNWDEQVFCRFLTFPGQRIAHNLNIIHSEITI
jgi:uncharacterized Zn-finger protein